MSQRGARRNLFVVCIFLAVLQLQCWRFSNPIIAYQRRTRLSSSNQPTAEELLDGFDNPPMELFEALYPSVDFGKKSTEIRYDEEAGIFKYVDIPEPISLDQIKPLKKVEYTRKALESIWTDLCRQKIIKGKITQMKIDDLLPHLMNETSIIDIIYKNFRERDEDVLPVYTTYRELRTLWLTNRNGLKINEEKEFNVKEALLLLDDFDPTDLQTSIFGKDEDEDEEEEQTEKKAEKKDAKEKKVKKKKGKKETVEEEIIEEENVEELIVTDQELRRVWRDKSKQQIGLPSKEYSDSSAFLLLDSALENDEFDFGDEEYYEAYMLPEINDPPERVPFGKFDPDDEEEDYPTLSAEEWKELGVSIEDLEDEVDEELDADTYTDEFYDAIEEAANELDHTPFFVNPIDRSMDITPGDMLEQFAGEMNYVEFTIDPAVDRIENLNWDSIPGLSNSKLDVLNYLTLPNEEFIDYNIPKKRSWELFDFPWGPDYDQLGGRRNPAQPETESDAKNPLSAYQVENYDGVLKFPEDEDHEEGTTKLSREEEDELFGDIDSVDDDGEIEGTEVDEESNNNNVDWDFDFGAINGDENPATSLVSSLPPSSDPNSELYDEDAYEDDWMQFHSVILAKQAKEKGFRRKLRYDEGLYTPFMDEYVNSSLWENPNQVYDGLLSKRLENVYSSPVKDFKVPKHWLTRKRYENYVGIEEYNKNIQYEEIGDNMDDVYEILSLQTVLDIMNLYLNDHMKIARKQDERKAFDRYYQAKLYNKSVTYPVLEPIPIMMIPDKDRGIQYSSQIFESNAQYQLFPYVPEPIVAFANESFEANPHTQYEFDSGSLLENYDWFPQKDLVHEIEEEKVESLQPIITFINHAGKLLSTKDDIIIFDYYGKMRDLAGIRVMMLGMAKECYPQIKDLRLETSRTHDSFDVGDHDWADPAEYVSRPLVKDDVFI